MIPSIVKADLILFTMRALNAIRKLAKKIVMRYLSLDRFLATSYIVPVKRGNNMGCPKPFDFSYFPNPNGLILLIANLRKKTSSTHSTFWITHSKWYRTTTWNRVNPFINAKGKLQISQLRI